MAVEFWAAIFIGICWMAVIMMYGDLADFVFSVAALVVWVGWMDYKKCKNNAFVSGFLIWFFLQFFMGIAMALFKEIAQ